MSILSGAIREFYNSATMYLTHNIHKNKVHVDLECLFILHVNDGDRCDSFGNTVIKAFRVVDIFRERIPVFPGIFRISLLHHSCVLLIVVSFKCFPRCGLF